MKTSWHDIWGSARGPVVRLAPQTRILCGLCVFAVCMVAPAKNGLGVAAIASILALWLILVQPPVRVFRSTLFLGLLLFLPYFLLTPLIRLELQEPSWLEVFLIPWTVLFRGLTAMLTSVAMATTLSAGDLRQGLSRLPVPAIVSGVLIQIVHQAAGLIYETRQVAAAIAVRGGSTGWRTAFRVLMSFPRVWLPRVIERAERVGSAMELRAYCQRDLAIMGTVAFSIVDILAIALAFSALAGGIALRVWTGA